MNPGTTEAAIEAAANAENIDMALGELTELDLGSDNADDLVEHIDELDAADADAVEGAIARAEIYEGAAETTTGIEAPAATPAKEKKAKSPKAPKAKMVRDLSALPPETFVLTDETADDTNKAAVMALRPEQKKIAEKFDNLFLSIAANKKPSIYTMACFNVLVAKGEVTSTDLVAALKASSGITAGSTKASTYSDGTARSQAGQLMALFGVVGIATRDKQTLKINPDSAVVAKLKAIAA